MRVGLTMRMLAQPGTKDMHDALSQDWGRFMAAAGLWWFPLPNRGEESLAQAKSLGLSALIFTGGGNAGREESRDHTESQLFQWAQADNIPVLGVCRGFQALQVLLGGALVPVSGHVARRHAITPCGSGAMLPIPAVSTRCPLLTEREVNSYHNLGISQLAVGLQPLALSADAEQAYVEAAIGQNMLGIMWHPEREALPHAEDVALVRTFFGV